MQLGRPKSSVQMSSASAILDRSTLDHAEALRDLRGDGALYAAFTALAATCVQAINRGGKIVLFGNGGSAADAQHIAAELVVRYKEDREPIAALALTTDSSILTATLNDYAADQIFARQVKALVKSEDVVIGISTSGASRNVWNGLHAATKIGACTAMLTSQRADFSAYVPFINVVVRVPSSVTARIQEMHILLGHALCEAIEEGRATNA
jgi:D-sedoheptulose 7-phosphate isomerase